MGPIRIRCPPDDSKLFFCVCFLVSGAEFSPGPQDAAGAYSPNLRSTETVQPGKEPGITSQDHQGRGSRKMNIVGEIVDAVGGRLI